jgi:hypothetical protein
MEIPNLTELIEIAERVVEWQTSTLMFAGAGVLCLVAGCAAILWRRLPPDRVMFSLLGCELTVEEGCQNWLVTGGIGSGKTNALNYLAANLSHHKAGWGGLWLDNKGNSEAELRAILRKYERAEDAVVLKVCDKPEHFYNLFEDPAFNPEILAEAIMEVAESGRNTNDSHEFFKRQGSGSVKQPVR